MLSNGGNGGAMAVLRGGFTMAATIAMTVMAV